MRAFIHQLKASFRGLLRTPSFTVVALLTLALTIGANTAVFSVVKVVFLNPLPFAEPDRIVILHTADLEKKYPDIPYLPASAPRYLDWKARQQPLKAVGAYFSSQLTLTGQGDPERVQALRIHGDLFQVLGSQARLGRTLAAADESGPNVVVLSNGFWQRRFGADPAVVGRALTLNGESAIVVGVMRPEFFVGRRDSDLFIPYTPSLAQFQGGRNNNFLTVMGRLNPGVSLAQARQSLDILGQNLAVEHPEDKAWSVGATPLREYLYGNQRPLLGMLILAGGLILAIGCANVANLMLSRAVSRQRETALRLALGGGLIQSLAPFLADGMILSVAGAGVGLAFAALVSGVLRPLVPAELAGAYGLDPVVLAFSMAASVLTALVCGLAPAFLFSRRHLAPQLAEGAKGTDGRHRHWIRGSLAAIQVALALILSVGFGTVWLSLRKIRQAPIGFSTDHRMVFVLNPNPTKHSTWPVRERLMRTVEESLSSLPGVRAVGTISQVPMLNAGINGNFTIPGREQENTIANFCGVNPKYFAAMGIPLLKGRGFELADYAAVRNVAIVSQSLADRYWPGQDPIGKIFRKDGIADQADNAAFTIVGVVGDVRWNNPADASFQETLYWPLYSGPFAAGEGFIIEAEGDPLPLVSSIRNALRNADPELPMGKVLTLHEVVERGVEQDKSRTILLGLLAGIALSLAGSGIFGMMAYTVAQRTREIGIRVALGGSPQRVAREIAGQGMALAFMGLGVGVIASVALGRFIATQLYEVSPVDPLIMALATLALGFVALLASLLPALRATRIDPMVALRSE